MHCITSNVSNAGTKISTNTKVRGSTSLEHERTRHSVYRQKKSTFWSMRLQEQKNQPRKLWRSLATTMDSKNSMKPSSTCPSAQQLLDFFDENVATVRRSTNGNTVLSYLESTAAVFDEFATCLIADIQKTIMEAPSKSCSRDPLPTSSLKDI